MPSSFGPPSVRHQAPDPATSSSASLSSPLGPGLGRRNVLDVIGRFLLESFRLLLLTGGSMLRLCTALVLVASFLVACGLDETYTGMGEGALPGDPLNSDDPIECPSCECNCTGGETPVDVDELDIEDLTGTAWRIEEMAFSAPLTGLFGDELNGVIAEEIEAGNINVILHVTGDDREAEILNLEVGAAVAASGQYSFSEDPAAMVCTLTGQLFTTDETGALTVPTDLMEPPMLPISALLLSGRIAADGTEITDGILDGILTGEDAAEIKIATKPLGDMLVALDVPPNIDMDDDGTPESWRFLGDFTATQVELVE